MERTWQEFIAGMNAADCEMVEAFRAAALALPDTHEKINRTEVAFRVQRVFAAAFVASHRLEIAIDLLREAHHTVGPGTR